MKDSVWFDEGTAKDYEAWYATGGRRADALEKALLRRLLGSVSQVRTALEVGCGTGHYRRHITKWGIRDGKNVFSTIRQGERGN